ncbi:hypothetical protein B0H66DRAFT_641598 [Apodospora peruviana]|uniref:Uncharacterized protein n=1 Tax=Apodospora peruviana TaxID=516989 RepID=A0AAE0I1F2_9PEZI|nr:hypothetical protein B0H66DRAFT_641598 [Apodospora peruviana]
MARLALFLSLFALLAAAVHAILDVYPECKPWCKANFADGGSCKAGSCRSLAAQGTGPCFECGPKKTVASMELCSGACTDTDTDEANCGGCGHACDDDATCTDGVCVAPTPPAPEFPTCESPFVCGDFPAACGSSVGDAECFCFSHVGGPGSACLDSWSLNACTGPVCSSDADCAVDRICITTCCGNTCGLKAAAGLCPNSASLKMLRRDRTMEELMATSPELNATLAAPFMEGLRRVM